MKKIEEATTTINGSTTKQKLWMEILSIHSFIFTQNFLLLLLSLLVSS
jgi:hypothetical protein